MTFDVPDALFDFSLALRLELPQIAGETDLQAALDLLPTNAGLPVNAVVAWPAEAQAGLLELLEIWTHVDAIARAMNLSLTYPADLTARTRSTKLGPGLVAWLRGAGPSLATMAGELDALREGRRRVQGLETEAPEDREVRRQRLGR